MKIAGIISIVLIVIYALIAMTQLWFEWLDLQTFIKISITFAVVIGVTVVVALIRREYINDEVMRKNKQID